MTKIIGKKGSKGYTAADYAALDHLTIEEAAAKLGVSTSFVYVMANRHDIAFRGTQKWRRNQIREDAENGLSQAQCAAKRGIPLHSVQAIASRWGITFNAKAKTTDMPALEAYPEVKVATPSRASERKAKMWRMYEAGHPPGVIAQYCGMTRGEVVLAVEASA